MKLVEAMTAEQLHATLDGLGREEVGLPLAIERKLSSIGAPGINWRMDTAETGFLTALRGKRRDVLVIEHQRFREHTVLIAARAHGTVLHVAWLLMVAPRLLNDLRRAVQLDAEPGARFDIEAEMTPIELMDLKAFIGISKLALRHAIQQLSDRDQDNANFLEESGEMES